MKKQGLTYAASGVDIDHGDQKISHIQPFARSTYRSGVMSGVGGFASLFSLKDSGFEGSDPILVSGTDGVGTKLLVAIMANRYFDLGQDLVAMCANDVLTVGAKPLFFLDYFATSALKESPMIEVVSGISDACRAIDCALVGGETAELPGLYHKHHFDLAGFCLGIVDRSKIIDGSLVQEGDVIIGLKSSGLHSNGFSLARKILFEKMDLKIGDVVSDENGMKRTIGDVLLTPTRLYVNSIHALLSQKVTIKAMAHITGGGIVGNVPRTIPPGLSAHIDLSSFESPPIFTILQENGPVDFLEMLRVFNLGVGFTLVVARDDAKEAIAMLSALGEECFVLGDIRIGTKPVVIAGSECLSH